MNIRPLHDRVLVRPMEEEKTSAGGIIIPDSANTEKPNNGTIIAAGNGKITDSGDVRAMDVKVGDSVLFGQYAGTAVKVNGEELMMMKEEDILAVIEG
ncbi:MAG: co-chaperone GroES [Cocleimonas sp.]